MTHRRRTQTAYAVAVLGPLALALVLAPFVTPNDQANVSFAFLILVLIPARLGGLGPAVVASLVAFGTVNFFFVEPVHALTVSTRSDLGVLLGFLAVAIVVSSLVAGLEGRRTEAERQAEESALLYELGLSLSADRDPESDMREVAELARLRLGFVELTVLVIHDQSLRVLHGSRDDHDLTQVAINAAGSAVALPVGNHRVAAAASLAGTGHLVLVATTSEPEPTERQLTMLLAFAARAAAAEERRMRQAEQEEGRLLQATDEQRRGLLSAVSHDLRTPLAAIKASASAMTTTPDAAERDELSSSIAAEVDRLDRMVGNLLDLSRVEGGVLVADREPVPVEELVGAVLHRLRGPLEGRPTHVDVPGNLPLVEVDFVQVEQALYNLVENAVQHTPSGSPITVAARARSGWVTIRVSDEGTGVPPADAERIFRRFEHGSAPSAGSGLGLAIARAYAVANGGGVELSPSERGAAFDFWLPVPELGP